MATLILAWRVLKTTFLSIGRNWSAVLRVAFLPLILPLAVLIGWINWAFSSGYVLKYLPKNAGGGEQIPVFAFTLVLLVLLGTIPVAVAWHRFDLRGEVPRALSYPLNFRFSLGYFGRSLLLLLIILLMVIVIAIPVALFVQPGSHGFRFMFGSLPTPATPSNFVLNAVIWMVVMAVILRWSLILPAGAIGNGISLSQSLAASRRAFGFGTFLLLGLFLHIAPIMMSVIHAELAVGAVSYLMLRPFLSLFWFMFGIALLTTLYGHAVEDRPLA